VITLKVTEDTQVIKLANQHGITVEKMACCAFLVGLEVIEANPEQFGELTRKLTVVSERKVRTE